MPGLTCLKRLLVVPACLLAAAVPASDVVVNDVPMDAATRQALESTYQVQILPGRYWYDPTSGAWGLQGGPAAGQILPGLRLGGPLHANASGGGTGVFINGRELHPIDVANLQRCVPTVMRGRYWVAASGVGGIEGGPPAFNLAALCGSNAPGGSSMRCENYGGGRFNCSNQRTGTGIISEGGGRAGVFTDGKLIMTPN